MSFPVYMLVGESGWNELGTCVDLIPDMCTMYVV